MSMLKYWLWLAELPGLRNQIRLALLEHFDSPEAVYYADPGEIALTEGMTREQAGLLKNKDLSKADRILGACEKQNMQILTLQDAAYPARLRNIYDPPCVLYVRGRLPVIDEEAAIAVVGTRTATPYGLREAEKFGFGLAKGGAAVVSGLARGIDSAAARGALRAGGMAIGVVGNGLDVIYPPENRYLYDDVAAAGALISEYPPGTEPARKNFPMRNRILSGLCLATLVIEAPEESGALITASTALEQGRDVFAVPGPVDAPMSRGCNRLIRDGAGLAADPWDLLREYAVHWPEKIHKEGAQEQPRVLGYREREKAHAPARPARETLSLSQTDTELTDDQITILKILGDEPMLVDDLIEATQIPTRRVLSALTMLEIENYVQQSSGKRYARNVLLTD